MNFNPLIYLAILIVLAYIFPVILGLLLFAAIIMLAIAIIMVLEGRGFKEIGHTFYKYLAHPVTNIIFPTVRCILLSLFVATFVSFFAIFLPLLVEILRFFKYGIWQDLTIYDFFVLTHNNIEPINIPEWKGLEIICNWFIFKADATIAIFIIFLILLFMLILITKNIDEKTAHYIFDDKNEPRNKK